MKSTKFQYISLLFALFAMSFSVNANNTYDAVVANDGSGDYTSLTDAINHIPSDNFQRYVIFIKNGTYNEKVRIDKDYLTLIGESKEGTVIKYQQAQKAWMAQKDHIGPAVINLHADDVVISNLTLENTIEEIGPTAYVIYSTGTRTILNDCKILNNGANTLTFKNYKEGMTYIKDCYIEGTVDFVKAMGWCHIEGCTLYQKEAIASIWHGTINNPNQKMVVKNTTFDGVQNFFLGRHHYDAEMLLVDCNFTKRMANKALYRKTYNKNPAKNKPYIFGDRHYYWNCQMEEGQYDWYADNLKEFNSEIKAKDMTPEWTFDGQWNPIKAQSLEIVDVKKEEQTYFIEFNQPVSVQGSGNIALKSNMELKFTNGKGRYILEYTCDSNIKAEKIMSKITSIDGEFVSTNACLNPSSLTR